MENKSLGNNSLEGSEQAKHLRTSSQRNVFEMSLYIKTFEPVMDRVLLIPEMLTWHLSHCRGTKHSVSF
jgi:hypothetical protein